MKRIIVDFYAAQNLGDDLFIKILVERYPSVQFIISAPKSKYQTFTENHKNLEIVNNSTLQNCINGIIERCNRLSLKLFCRAIFGYIAEYRYTIAADCYIHIGGSIFIEPPFNQKALKHRKKARELSVLKHFNTTPKIVLGANFGEYYSTEFLEFYRKSFSKFNDVSFRDEYSYTLFSELENVRYNPDIVFSLAKRYRNSARSVDSYGFSVINLRNRSSLAGYAEGYISSIASTIAQFITNGSSVTLFSFCAVQGDMLAIEEILGRLEHSIAEKVEVVGYGNGYDIDSFLERYFATENIFATRFHATVLSLGAEQNLLPIVYSKKTLNVLKDIRYRGYYKHIENMHGDISAKLILRIKQNRFMKQPPVFGADLHFDWLDNHIKN